MALGGINNAMSVENRPGGIVYEAGRAATAGAGNAFGASPLESLNAALTAGASRADAGVGSAQSGVNAVLAGGGQINAAIGNMNAQAGNVVGQANAVNRTAGQVKDAYAQLSPIAALLGDQGKDLYAEGSALSEQAKDVFGQGAALVGMDPNATGLAGEFIKYWQSLSPDRYVSQAASDTQAAQQNAMGQAMRNLSRMGVSPTSGAAGALQRQYQQALATALAAAKTKARQVGLDAQAAQLDKMVGAANTLYNMGNQTEQNALAAKNAGIGAEAKGADVLATQGQGYAQAGSLEANAGQLFGTAANIYGNAGELQNQYLNTVNAAYKNLSSAQLAAADYYRAAAATEVGAVNSGGRGGGGGVSVSSPDWVKMDSGRDTSQSGSPWFSTWMNPNTGAVATGDGLFNPNK